MRVVTLYEAFHAFEDEFGFVSAEAFHVGLAIVDQVLVDYGFEQGCEFVGVGFLQVLGEVPQGADDCAQHVPVVLQG